MVYKIYNQGKKSRLIVGENNNQDKPPVTAVSPDLADNSKVNPWKYLVNTKLKQEFR